MPLWLKLTPPRVSQFYIELYKEIFKRLLFLNRLWKIDQSQQDGPLFGPLLKMFKWF